MTNISLSPVDKWGPGSGTLQTEMKINGASNIINVLLNTSGFKIPGTHQPQNMMQTRMDGTSQLCLKMLHTS